MAKIAFPFLVIPPELIETSDFMIGAPGEPLNAAEEIFEGWDYATPLEARLDVGVSFDEVAEALQIDPSNLQLKVSLKAGTGVGTFPRRIETIDEAFFDERIQRTTLGGNIASARLSGRLKLECQITLSNDSKSSTSKTLSPQSTGSRLWIKTHDVLLEGGGASRFPMESVSFKEAFRGKPHQHAPWFIDWRPGSWHRDFSGSVRVYLNSDISEIEERVATGDPLTLRSILADTMSQMILSAVEDPDFSESVRDSDRGSTAQQISYWMGLAFPEAPSPTSIKSNPGQFNAAIHAAADLSPLD